MKLLLDEYDEIKIKQITHHKNDPVWLLHTNRGYVLTDGWLTDWVCEYGILGNEFAIDNILYLTPKQIEKTKKAYLKHKKGK